MQAGFDEGPTGPACTGRSQRDPRFARGAQLRIPSAMRNDLLCSVFVFAVPEQCLCAFPPQSVFDYSDRLRTAVNPESNRPTADRNSARHDARGTVPTPSLRLA
jgi:hypothetical protein